MAGYNDMLGDEFRYHETVESLRKGEVGEPVIVRLEAASSFARQLKVFIWPLDDRLVEATDAAAVAVFDELKCTFAHVWEGEASFVLWNSDDPVACEGNFQELASYAASIFTDVFNQVGRGLFPEAYGKSGARFKATSFGLPDLDLAARYFDWREREARRLAVTAIARSIFEQKLLDGRSQQDMKELMASRVGLDYDAYYPERFRRGDFFRRMKYERYLTEEELARIPENRRPEGPVIRSSVMVVPEVPPLALVDNLAGYVFHREEPVVLDLPFAASVIL